MSIKWSSVRNIINNDYGVEYFNADFRIRDSFGHGKILISKIDISAFANRLPMDNDIRGIMRRTYGKPPYNF